MIGYSNFQLYVEYTNVFKLNLVHNLPKPVDPGAA